LTTPTRAAINAAIISNTPSTPRNVDLVEYMGLRRHAAHEPRAERSANKASNMFSFSCAAKKTLNADEAVSSR
jgi:O-acetylhomoserine/O-acetylserine sulfhydrylase-like pyridoxal-dependent enzyme